MASGPNASPFPLAPPVPTPDQPDAGQNGAPGGRFFSEGELPSIPVKGGSPATTGGYSPDPSKAPQGQT